LLNLAFAAVFFSFSGIFAQFTLRTWLQFLCLRHFLHQHYSGACAQSLPNEFKSEVNSIWFALLSGVSGWMVRPPDVPDGQNCLGNLFRFRTFSLGYLFRCQAIWADLLLHLELWSGQDSSWQVTSFSFRFTFHYFPLNPRLKIIFLFRNVKQGSFYVENTYISPSMI
jgi:hypothetical protein